MKLYGLLACCILVAQVGVQAQDDNYGADKANKRNIPTEELLGGRTDFDYLALKDHPAASGVALGGIGVGNVEFAPDGRFVRLGLNNIHAPIAAAPGSFFALWYRAGGRSGVCRLVRDSGTVHGIKGIAHTAYTGLFPRATLKVGVDPLKVAVNAWSSLVPHDVKNSSLPMVWFEVEVSSAVAADVSVAFSWQDIIGRGLRDPLSVEGMDGQILARSALMNGEEWPERAPVETLAAPFAAGGAVGVRQYTPRPIVPRKATFQNYVQEVGVLAVPGAGERVTMSLSNESWESFLKNGIIAGNKRRLQGGSSAVAIKAHLRAGERRAFRFLLAWYYPELVPDREHGVPGSYWAGGSDYGRYFHRYFNGLGSLVSYGVAHRAELLAKTIEWQAPVLASTLPDWYKFKLINSGYVIYTNMILNKKGDMTVNEGGMGGLAGTMDQRISSHPFYQKFFTQLDRSEMAIFGDAQAFDGSINHFIGHYYVGMGTVGGRVPTENHWMLDNTEGWIFQVVKDYEQTGDTAYLRRFAGRIKDGMKFLKSRMPAGVNIPVGPTTYDDFTHPPIYSYGSGMYLAGLKAAAAAAEALRDTLWQRELEAQFELSRKEMIQRLWNGHFFAYGAQVDGTGRLDSVLFTGQLAGSFVSRYAGWGDIVDLRYVDSSLVSQFRISLAKTPDYYANKVWDMRLGHGIDQRGSQCWPFYLESYTAYPAIQAGYVADGLDIMKHIQLVHLRRGLTWSQNLWNPGPITYMTAPVSWFSTDVLAGAGINVPKGELRLGPVLSDSAYAVYPLFYPSFWARLVVDKAERRARFEVTKTFAGASGSVFSEVVFRRLIITPPGVGTADAFTVSIPPFRVKAGAVLDLSPFLTQLEAGRSMAPVLRSSAEATPK